MGWGVLITMRNNNLFYSSDGEGIGKKIYIYVKQKESTAISQLT